MLETTGIQGRRVFKTRAISSGHRSRRSGIWKVVSWAFSTPVTRTPRPDISRLKEIGLVCRLGHAIRYKMEAPMSQYGIYEAKTKLATLIKQVQQGERVTITNRNEPVVDLVLSANRAIQRARRAIVAIKAMRTAIINQKQFSEMRLRGRR